MNQPSTLPLLQLRRNEDRRIRQGHHWVYSNEVDNAATPLKAFQPGDQALLVSAAGKPLGVVYVNPHSLICARVIDRHRAEPIGQFGTHDRLRREVGDRDRALVALGQRVTGEQTTLRAATQLRRGPNRCHGSPEFVQRAAS